MGPFNIFVQARSGSQSKQAKIMHFSQRTAETHKPKLSSRASLFLSLSYNLLLAESLILPSLSLIYLSIMEIIASIIQIIPNLCTWISKQTGYVRNLKTNVDALMEEAPRLGALCADIEEARQAALVGRQRLTSQAQTCLDQARPILDEIDSIKSQFDQRRTFCSGCFPDLCSDYTLGKRAFKKLEPVRRFIKDGSGIQRLAMSSSPSVVKRDVEDLMEEAKKLKAQCDDMESEGRKAPRKGMRLTNQAQTWLGRARAILTEIENIKSEFDGIFPNLPSTSTLGERAFQMLERVRRFIDEKRDIKLVAMSSPPRVMEMDDVPTVGQSSAQQTMVKIWDLLHDEHTSVIWIYGMGGIGKTTLMKAINNKLKAASEFDYVIWVTLSKQHDSQKIQKDIMSRLHLKFDEDSDSDRSMQLRQYLTDIRYMLILDDLWDPINLSAIGIPANKENRSKIAITTRNAKMSVVQVRSDMKAEVIRVEPLTEDEAWDLFAAKVGKEVVLLPIKNVAKEVARECGGLPLAIVVVAKAMEGESSEALWRNTLRALKASAPKIGDMEDQVFRLLQNSYDDLKDEEVYISGGDNYPPGAGVMVTHTEGLKLFAVGVTDVSQLVGVANGLRMLDIEGCGKLECILDWSEVGGNALQNIEELRLSLLTSLQKLFKGEVPRRCLQNLNKIYLNNCYILKGLFTSEMAQNLDQLHTLDVRDCKGLKEIIAGHDESLPKNPFPQLRNITLKGLFNLESIICHDTLALPSLIKLQIDRCRKLRLPKRPDTTDWPSITHGNARWQANPQYSEHMQRPDEE